MFLLVDCNNFYASCERVFNPRLNKRPIVILSNNDGCIVARSNEAKALGIPMGAPLFQYRDLIAKNGVAVYSSNYALYGDMSRRVMDVLHQFSADVQVYSIDEAFIVLPDNQLHQLPLIREAVKRWTGIPVSIGAGRTKTLAKAANALAKQGEGVLILDTEEKRERALEQLPVEKIWGIGSNYRFFLHQHGITTAKQLCQMPDSWIKQHMTLVGLRMVWELRGKSCLPLEEAVSAKQSITSSRSFGYPVTRLEELSEALAAYATRAGEKLRQQHSVAEYLSVFVQYTSPSLTDRSYLSTGAALTEPTAYTPLLIERAKALGRTLFRKGCCFYKAGITLHGIREGRYQQADLFTSLSPQQTVKQQTLMRLVDKLNQDGSKVFFAAEGIKQPWQMKQHRCSKRYTTRWNEILAVSVG